MKALNYIAAIVFACMAIITAVIAVLTKEYHLFFLTGISGVLAAIARHDYTKCQKEEEL